MPHLRLETNVSVKEIPEDFLLETTKIIASTLGKPESYCAVTIVPDQIMMFGGSSSPCATATLMSIGQLGVEQNKKHSKVLFKHIEEKLGIPQNRMYITFIDAKPSDVGYDGHTFH